MGSYTGSAGQTMTLAERWNGARWKIEATPNPAGMTSATLYGISCPSRRACTAVGSYYGGTGPTMTLAERFNGTRWEVQATPNPPGTTFEALYGVSCPSSRACTAVGYGPGKSAFVERWTRTGWVVQPTPELGPSPAAAGALTAISCPSERGCIGTGSVDYGGDVGIPLTERWNGTNWVVNPLTPEPGSILSGVSCPSTTPCTAVGSYDYYSTTGRQGTIAERWNGTNWTIQPTPNPIGGTNPTLNGVSCPSAHACTAVGTYTSSTGQTVTLAGRWNGTRWEIQPTS